MAPKLSVAFPTFNRAAWLNEALGSILVPDLDCEVVVIDNGSSDGTAALLREWSLRDPRVRFERWELNVGIDGYPSALSMCRGEYVALFADDDEMLPGGLERKMAFLDQHPETGLVFSPVRFMDQEGRDQGELAWGRIGELDIPGDPAFFEQLILGNLVPMGAAMWRRSLAPTAELMHNLAYAPSGDWNFWLGLARKTRVGYLREPTARIRMHRGQATQDHGVRAGGFVDANLNIWRHWMLEADPPYVPSLRTWEAMASNYAGTLKATFQDNVVKITEGLFRLKAVLDAQNVLLNRAEPPEGLSGPEAFLFEPDWSGAGWVEVLLSYCEAFSPGEKVALVLQLGGEGAPSPEDAGQAVLQIIAKTGRETFPDVILVERPGNLLETLRQYPHIQRIPPSGELPEDLEGPLGRRFLDARRRLVSKENA